MICLFRLQLYFSNAAIEGWKEKGLRVFAGGYKDFARATNGYWPIAFHRRTGQSSGGNRTGALGENTGCSFFFGINGGRGEDHFHKVVTNPFVAKKRGQRLGCFISWLAFRIHDTRAFEHSRLTSAMLGETRKAWDWLNFLAWVD